MSKTLLRLMDWMFRCLRRFLPIVVLSDFSLLIRLARLFKRDLPLIENWVIVTRFDDVEEVLSRERVFRVPYAPKLAVIMDGGNIFMGMQDTPESTRDKTNLQMAVPRSDIPNRVVSEVDRIARDLTAGAHGRLDVVQDLALPLTQRFFGHYFGLEYGPPGASAEEVTDWAHKLFAFLFTDPFNDPASATRAEPIAGEVRGYVERLIEHRREATRPQDDILGRLLVLQAEGHEGLEDDQIRNQIISLIVGGLPQPPMAVPQLLDQLLDRPDQLAAARDAARQDDDRLLAGYVFEALRFNPLTPGMFRIAVADYKLARGSWRARTVRRERTVFAVSRSAMFDSRKLPAPRQFRPDRPDYSYLHFGYGLHTCFGRYINLAMIPLMLKPLLARRNLRRSPGEDGRLQMRAAYPDSPAFARIFPSSLVVEFD